MHDFVAELLCCPACGSHPLELTTIEAADDDRTESGYLHCARCGGFYFVIAGIPRLLGEEFAELIDLSLVKRFPAAFEAVRGELDAFLARLDRPGQSSVSEWNLDDVEYWENEVYGNTTEMEAGMQRVARARPDAGNRAFPRERTIFRHIRPRLDGEKVLLDVGCGMAQTIRTLCDPAEVGYRYIGADLSLSALKFNRDTMRGDFVQCSADRLPFRPGAADAVVMLGTLHHLADQERTLTTAVGTLREGGWLGLDEVVFRGGLGRRLRLSEAESAHNEFVSPATIDKCLAGMRVVARSREYSPVRGVLALALDEAMRTRPWLTRLVLGLDWLAIKTVGRLTPRFRGSQLLLCAQKP